MDVRSPLFQNIACILMGVMFLNPIVSTAAELTVDAAAGGNTNLGSAQNGVPVVNIATPKVLVKAIRESLFVCEECEATWFSYEDIGVKAFVDY